MVIAIKHIMASLRGRILLLTLTVVHENQRQSSAQSKYMYVQILTHENAFE